MHSQTAKTTPTTEPTASVASVPGPASRRGRRPRRKGPSLHPGAAKAFAAPGSSENSTPKGCRRRAASSRGRRIGSASADFGHLSVQTAPRGALHYDPPLQRRPTTQTPLRGAVWTLKWPKSSGEGRADLRAEASRPATATPEPRRLFDAQKVLPVAR